MFIKAESAATSTYKQIPFVHFTGGEFTREFSDGGVNAIRGTLDHTQWQTVPGRVIPYFTVSMQLTQALAAGLLPYSGLTLANGVGVSFPVAETLAPFDLCIVLDTTTTYGRQYTFGECYIGVLTLAAQKGSSPPMITMRCVCKSFTPAAPDATTLATTGTEGQIFNFSEASLTAFGQVREFDRFRVSINYRLLVEHMNNVYPTHICPSDHDIDFMASTLYASKTTGAGGGCLEPTNMSFLETPMSGDVTGGAVSLGFARAVTIGGPATHTYLHQWDIPNAKIVPRFPDVTKADYIRMPLHMKGFRLTDFSTGAMTALGQALKITNTDTVT